MCDDDKLRGAVKRGRMKRDKWGRQVALLSGTDLLPPMSSEVAPERTYFGDRSRKLAEAIAFPGRVSFRGVQTDSPPPKHKRTRAGKNKGKPDACPFCRPQICARMNNLAVTTRYLRTIRTVRPDNILSLDMDFRAQGEQVRATKSTPLGTRRSDVSDT